MMGNYAFYLERAKIPFSAGVHRMRIDNALFIKPFVDLEIANDLRTGSIRDPDAIPYMILVAMTDKDKISLQLVNFNNVVGKIIRCDERIEQDFLPLDSYRKTGVTVVCKLHNKCLFRKG